MHQILSSIYKFLRKYFFFLLLRPRADRKAFVPMEQTLETFYRPGNDETMPKWAEEWNSDRVTADD
jgi:hypothetical protein